MSPSPSSSAVAMSPTLNASATSSTTVQSFGMAKVPAKTITQPTANAPALPSRATGQPQTMCNAPGSASGHKRPLPEPSASAPTNVRDLLKSYRITQEIIDQLPESSLKDLTQKLFKDRTIEDIFADDFSHLDIPPGDVSALLAFITQAQPLDDAQVERLYLGDPGFWVHSSNGCRYHLWYQMKLRNRPSDSTKLQPETLFGPRGLAHRINWQGGTPTREESSVRSIMTYQYIYYRWYSAWVSLARVDEKKEFQRLYCVGRTATLKPSILEAILTARQTMTQIGDIEKARLLLIREHWPSYSNIDPTQPTLVMPDDRLNQLMGSVWTGAKPRNPFDPRPEKNVQPGWLHSPGVHQCKRRSYTRPMTSAKGRRPWTLAAFHRGRGNDSPDPVLGSGRVDGGFREFSETAGRAKRRKLVDDGERPRADTQSEKLNGFSGDIDEDVEIPEAISFAPIGSLFGSLFEDGEGGILDSILD